MSSDNLAITLPDPPDPNIPQRKATIPEHDVWVSASAGSGKTKVLTDRVLRLLLPDPDGRWKGAAPHKILCITFTKAAAAEMSLRVQKRLGKWALMDEAELHKELSELLDRPPSEEVLRAARQLFSTVLDTTGGMSIMTIHAFCQSILGRFAIEAGVTPGFTVLEDARATEMLRQIVDHLIMEVEQNAQSSFKQSFKRIATYLDLDSLRETLLSMMAHSRDIGLFMSSLDTDGDIQARLLSVLNYQPEFRPDLADEKLLHMSRAFADKGGKLEQEYAAIIAGWLALEPDSRLSALETLQSAFLNKDGTQRKFTKAIVAHYPELAEIREYAIEQIDIYLDEIAKKRQSEQTHDLLQILGFCMGRYAAYKKELNALDFNDLILKTRYLLESENMDWVQFKLDEGIDHILVDEAQDTNIHQWTIIRHLSDEFLSGLGNDERLRSLFVVGDEKQSIFSFHGADPEAFHKMRDFFEKRSQAAQREFKKIPLETSFRSTFPVLQLVDTVFESPELAVQLGLPRTQKLTHFARRKGAAGLVELWEYEAIPQEEKRNLEIEWKLPQSQKDESQSDSEKRSTSSPMAGRIASTIAGWLQNGEILKSENRPIEPRDILVLVRTRTSFMPDLVRQLKLRGVPVSGIDRMKLTDQIAVLDCLALARFARFPDDDLSLACLLKSPFIRLSEDQLMELALGRKGSLWDSVQALAPQSVITWLKDMIAMSQTEKPFDFFDAALNRPCPYDMNSSGWHAFATCLGVDCIDPLDEFLSYCLSQEADGVYSLEELVLLLQASEIEIKRDAEDGDKGSLNQVRIMTVHASKGLEAPIVFLPDTTSVPGKKKIDPLQWIKATGNQPAIPLWAARSADSCKAYLSLKDEAYDKAMAEYLRLLYVALTRPKDRLYVMGEGNLAQFKDNCWYKYIYDAFQRLPATFSNGIWRYETKQEDIHNHQTEISAEMQQTPAPPTWIKTVIKDDEIARQITIQPSRIDLDDDIQARSPLHAPAGHGHSLQDKKAASLAQKNRFKRGLLTHKLFQVLPDLPVEGRQRAAEQFLERMGHDITAEIRAQMIDETLRILNDDIFKDVFGPDSLAEVPISGDMGDGRAISGQIDRLVIGHNKILIVDFKTNRPSPRHQNDIPVAYKNQLRSYKTAIQRIFPDREVICALLWTDQPLLMAVDI